MKISTVNNSDLVVCSSVGKKDQDSQLFNIAEKKERVNFIGKPTGFPRFLDELENRSIPFHYWDTSTAQFPPSADEGNNEYVDTISYMAFQRRAQFANCLPHFSANASDVIKHGELIGEDSLTLIEGSRLHMLMALKGLGVSVSTLNDDIDREFRSTRSGSHPVEQASSFIEHIKEVETSARIVLPNDLKERTSEVYYDMFHSFVLGQLVKELLS